MPTWRENLASTVQCCHLWFKCDVVSFCYAQLTHTIYTSWYFCLILVYDNPGGFSTRRQDPVWKRTTLAPKEVSRSHEHVPLILGTMAKYFDKAIFALNSQGLEQHNQRSLLPKILPSYSDSDKPHPCLFYSVQNRDHLPCQYMGGRWGDLMLFLLLTVGISF